MFNQRRARRLREEMITLVFFSADRIFASDFRRRQRRAD